jgi:hypothetical protein
MARKVAGRSKGYWIAGAIQHPGALRRTLGTPKGQPIPEGQLERAAAGAYGPKTAARARLALRLRRYRHRARH